MEKLCEAMSESFMETNSRIIVTTEYTGSSAGIESLTSGSVDIGNASRSLKDEEKTNGIVENVVALDGIAVIVDKENTVNDLTQENLAKLYKGEISEQNEAISTWFDYIASEEGKEIIKKVGLIVPN